MDDTVLQVCEAIDGISIAGITFELAATRGDGRHWVLAVPQPGDLGGVLVGPAVTLSASPPSRRRKPGSLRTSGLHPGEH